MPQIYNTRFGLRFNVWELTQKQFDKILEGVAALVGDWRTVQKHEKHLGFVRMGTEPTFEVFLRKPYTLSTLAHEIYHAVKGSEILKEDEEKQASTLGDLVQAIWENGRHGLGEGKSVLRDVRK